MPRLLRYRLVNVGDADAIYPDITFEPGGESFCVLQPNGTGKSTAVKFMLHALVSGRDVDSGSGRALKDYLVPEGRRVAHVALEFAGDDADGSSRRRIVAGFAADRRGGENRKLHYVIVYTLAHGEESVEEARARGRLNVGTLPLSSRRTVETEKGPTEFNVAATLEELRDFFDERGETFDGELHVFPPGHGGWETVADTLRRYGLDEAAWKEIAYLNRSESSFDQLVKDHPTSAKLVDGYLLPRVEVESSLVELRRHADQVRLQLVQLPEIEASIAAFEGIEKRLSRLAQALDAAVGADTAASTAAAQSNALAARAQGALAFARAELARAKADAGQARSALASTEETYARARLARAAAQVERAARAFQSAEAAHRAVADAERRAEQSGTVVESLLAAHERARAQAEADALSDQLARRGDSQEALVSARTHAAERLAARLEVLLTANRGALAAAAQTRSGARDRERTAGERQNTLRQAHAQAVAKRDADQAWLSDATSTLEKRGFADLDALHTAQVKAESLSVNAALVVGSAEEADTAARAERDRALAAVGAAEPRLAEAEALLRAAGELRDRETNLREPAQTALQRLELADLHREGPDALVRLSERTGASEDEQRRLVTRREGLEVELAYFDAHGVLRPNDDVVAVADALAADGLRPESGPRYLQQLPAWSAERRRALLEQHPGLAAGFVLESAEVDRVARRFEAITEGLVLRGPVFLYRRERLVGDAHAEPAFELPFHASLTRLIDVQAAKQAIAALRDDQARLRFAERVLHDERTRAVADSEAIQRYLEEFPEERAQAARQGTAAASADVQSAKESLRLARAGAARAHESATAAETQRKAASARLLSAKLRAEELTQLESVYAAPWKAHVEGAASQDAAATALLGHIDVAAREHDGARRAREVAEDETRSLESAATQLRNEREDLPEVAAAKDGDEAIEGLRTRYRAARASLDKSDGVRAMLEQQLAAAKAREQAAAGRARKERARLDAEFEPQAAARSERVALLDEGALHRERADADALWKTCAAETRRARETLADAKADLGAKQRGLQDLAGELERQPVPPEEESEETLSERVATAQESMRAAKLAVAHREQAEGQISAAAVRLTALLSANQLVEEASAPAGESLDLPGFERLSTELGAARAALAAREAERHAEWDKESDAYRALFEHLADAPPAARSKIGTLPALQHAHDARQWAECREALAVHGAALARLEEGAQLEKARLDEDRTEIVADLARTGEDLAQRLRRIAPLSRVRIAGSLEQQMLSVDFKYATEERMRERAEVLFAGYLDAVRSGRLKADVAQTQLLRSPELVRCAVDGEIVVRFMKPQENLAQSRLVRWEEAVRWSGGETFVVGLVLLMSLLAYRAHDSNKSSEASQVILLDNPVGKVNAPHLLKIAFDLARANRFQLIAFTGIREPGVVAQFERAVSVCKIPSGRRFLIVQDSGDELARHASSFAGNDLETAALEAEGA